MTVTLNPTFAPTRTVYNVSVAYNTASVAINATPIVGATATISSGTQTGNTINLNSPGTSTTITILVTAADGVTTQTYTVTVNRASGPGVATEVTVTAGTFSINKIFDNTTSAGASSGSLNITPDLPAGVNVQAAPRAFSSINAGDYEVIVDLTLTGANAGNFVLVNDTITVPGNISQRNVAEATVGQFTGLSFTGLPQVPNAAVTWGGVRIEGTWSAVTNEGDSTTFTPTDSNFTGTLVRPFNNWVRVTVTGIDATPSVVEIHRGSSREINVAVRGERRPQDYTRVEWTMTGNVCCTSIVYVTGTRALLTVCATQPLGNGLSITATVRDDSQTVDFRVPISINIPVNVVQPTPASAPALGDVSYADRIILPHLSGNQLRDARLNARASLNLERTFSLGRYNFFPDRIVGCEFLSQNGSLWHDEYDLVSVEIISHCDPTDHSHAVGTSCEFARVEVQVDGTWVILSPGVPISPLLNFRIMGQDTGSATLRIIHLRSEQQQNINFNVTSLRGQLYFMRVSPSGFSNLRVSYRVFCNLCNGDDSEGCTVCIRTPDVSPRPNGEFVLFDEEGIFTDIRITANRGGYFYSGYINPGALLGGELSSLPMYPLNPVTLTRFGAQRFNVFYGTHIRDTDGTIIHRQNEPFVGTVYVSGGFSINGVDRPVTWNTATNSSVVPLPVGPGGFIQLNIDPGAFDNIDIPPDLEIIYEISFGDGFVPLIVRLPLFSNVSPFMRRNPRLFAMPWDTARNPFTITEHRYINDRVRDVSENENVGPSNDLPTGTLINSVVAMANSGVGELQFVNVCGNYNPLGMFGRQRTRPLNYTFLSGRYAFYTVEFDLDEPIAGDPFCPSRHPVSLFPDDNRVQNYVIRGQIDGHQHSVRLPYNIVNGVGLFVNLNDLPLELDLSSMLLEGEHFEYPMRGYHPSIGPQVLGASGVAPMFATPGRDFGSSLTSHIIAAGFGGSGMNLSGDNFYIKIAQDNSDPFKWKISGYIKIMPRGSSKPKVYWVPVDAGSRVYHANKNCHVLQSGLTAAGGLPPVSGSETDAKKARPGWGRCTHCGTASWRRHDELFEKNYNKAKDATTDANRSTTNQSQPNTGGVRPFYKYFDYGWKLSAFFEASASWKPGDARPVVSLDQLGVILGADASAGFGWRKLIPTKVGFVTLQLSVDASLGVKVTLSMSPSGIWRSTVNNNPNPQIWFSLKGDANGLVRLRGSIGMEWVVAAVNVGVFGQITGGAGLELHYIRNRPDIPPNIDNTVCPHCREAIEVGVRNYIRCRMCGHYHHATCWENNKGCAVNYFLSEFGFRCEQWFEGYLTAGWSAGIDALWRLGLPDIRFRIFRRTIVIRLSISGRQLIWSSPSSGAWFESDFLGRSRRWPWPLRRGPDGRIPSDDDGPAIIEPDPDDDDSPDQDGDDETTTHTLPRTSGEWIRRYAESSREHMLIGDITIRSNFDGSFAVAVWPSLDLSGVFTDDAVWNCLQRANECRVCTDEWLCATHANCDCGQGDEYKLQRFLEFIADDDLASRIELSTKIYRGGVNGAWEDPTHRITTPSDHQMNALPVVAICTTGGERVAVAWQKIGISEGEPIPVFSDGVDVILCNGIISHPNGDVFNCDHEIVWSDRNLPAPTQCPNPDCNFQVEPMVPLEIGEKNIMYNVFDGASWATQAPLVESNEVGGDIRDVSIAVNGDNVATSFSVVQIEELADGFPGFGAHYIYARQVRNAFASADLQSLQLVAAETSTAEYSRPMIEAYRQGFVVSYHTNNLNGRQDVILRKLNANGTMDIGILQTISATAVANGLRPLSSNYQLVPNFGIGSEANNTLAIAWVNFNPRTNRDEIHAVRLSVDGDSDVISVPIMLVNACRPIPRSEAGRESFLLDGIMGSGNNIRVLHRSTHRRFHTAQNRTAIGAFADRFQYFFEFNPDMVMTNSYIPVEFYIRNVGLTPINGLSLSRRGSGRAPTIEPQIGWNIAPGQSGRFTAFVPVGETIYNFEYTLTATFVSGVSRSFDGTVRFLLPSISTLPLTRSSINSSYVNDWEFALGLTNDGMARLVNSNYNVRLDFFLTPTFQEDSRISRMTISDTAARSLMDNSVYNHLIDHAAFEAGRIHAHAEVRDFVLPNDELLLFVEAIVVDQSGAPVPEKDYRFNRTVVAFNLTEPQTDTGISITGIARSNHSRAGVMVTATLYQQNGSSWISVASTAVQSAGSLHQATGAEFTLSGILPGTYRLVLAKPGHLSVTVYNISVGTENVDLMDLIAMHNEGLVAGDMVSLTLIPGSVTGWTQIGVEDASALIERWGTDFEAADLIGFREVGVESASILAENWGIFATVIDLANPRSD